MNADWPARIIAGLALLGNGVGIYLNLKIRKWLP